MGKRGESARFIRTAPRPRAACAPETVEQNRASSFPGPSCRLTLPHGRLFWPHADTLWMPCRECFCTGRHCTSTRPPPGPDDRVSCPPLTPAWQQPSAGSQVYVSFSASAQASTAVIVSVPTHLRAPICVSFFCTGHLFCRGPFCAFGCIVVYLRWDLARSCLSTARPTVHKHAALSA